jgi:hypothetical protein
MFNVETRIHILFFSLRGIQQNLTEWFRAPARDVQFCLGDAAAASVSAATQNNFFITGFQVSCGLSV